MGYEFKQEDVFRLASFVRTDVREKGEELHFTYCPFCHGGKHGDKDTFAVNLNSGAYKCLRSSCGAQGHFVQLAREVGYALDFGVAKKEYRRLPQREVTVRAPAVEYLAARSIGRETVERYKITTQKDNNKILAFPFYDDGGQLVTVKYRKTDYQKGRDKNKEWFEAGTEPILFGMEQARSYLQPLVICEGQIDSLSLAECGIPNAVSVPNGANGFTWVTGCYDWVMKFPSIIVFGDNEHGKITLVDEIAKRFPLPIAVVPSEMYYGEKDANDILRRYGKEAIFEAVEGAKAYTIPHIKRLADVEAVDLNSLPKIKSGIYELDRVLGGFYLGQVVLMTGKRGEGKSTCVGQIINEAFDQDVNVLAYSGELTDYHFKRWIDFQAAGPNHVVEMIDEYGERSYTIDPGTIEKISAWYADKAYIYDNSSLIDDSEYEGLIDTIEKAVPRYNIQLVCIDNLMTAMDVNPTEDLYRAQSTFLKRLKQLAVRHNIVVILVAHPRKSGAGPVGDYNESVSGSADITNRVDVVITYERTHGEEEERGDGKIIVSKNRLTGKLTNRDSPIYTFYSQSTKRITSVHNGTTKKYGWERQSEPDVYESNYTLPF